MAKASTRKAPAKKPAARKPATKSVKIVGVDKKTADQVKAAARAADDEELTDKVQQVQRGTDAPEAGDTPKARRAKAQELFDKADEAGQAAIIDATRMRSAALGGL